MSCIIASIIFGVSMIKALIKLVVLAAVILLFAQPEYFNAIVVFMLTGAITGTSIVIPFWMMILAAAVISIVMMLYIFRQPLFIGDTIHAQKKQQEVVKKKPRKKLKLSRYRIMLHRKTRKSYQPAHSTSQ